MRHWMHHRYLPVIALAALLPGIGAQAAARVEPVCIVTELSGRAQTQTNRGIAAVALLTEFAAGARTRLEPGARMVVLYVKSGDQFALLGPSLVRFAAEAPSAVSGADPVPLRPLRGKDGTPLRIRVDQVTQAAVVARTGPVRPVVALALSDTVTLQAAPVLRWREPEPGLRYQVVLEDDEGATLLTRSVQGDSLVLPGELALVPGPWYRWSISARSSAGMVYGSQHRFRLADAATAQAAANFQPTEYAAMAERVAYAVWLEAAGLRDEASAQWAQLAVSGVPLPSARGTSPPGVDQPR